MKTSYRDLAREVLEELGRAEGVDLMHLVDHFGPAVQLWPVGVPSDLWDPCTRLGGLPSLLPGDDWPMAECTNPKVGRFPLIFVAQLNLAEVAPMAADLVDLPSEGWLLFFVNERRLIQIEDSQPLCQVLWVRDPITDRKPKPPRVNLDQHCPFLDHSLGTLYSSPINDEIRKLKQEGKTKIWIDKQRELQIHLEDEYKKSRSETPYYLPVESIPTLSLSVPRGYYASEEPFNLEFDVVDGMNRIMQRRFGIQAPTPMHEVLFKEEHGPLATRKIAAHVDDLAQIGGSPADYNASIEWLREFETSSGMQGLPDGESRNAKDNEAESDPLVLLLQLPSTSVLEGHGMMHNWNLLWGDVGFLSFFLRRSDLARRDFEKTICMPHGSC